MKIANLVFSFNTGGAENLLVDIINNWDTSDEQLLVIINNEKNDTLIAKICCNPKAKVICLNRTPGSNAIPYMLRLNRVLTEYQPDVIHCHCSNTVRFVLPVKLLHPRWKLYFTVHSTNIYPSISTLDKWLHKLFLKKVIAISKVVREGIVSSGLSSSKIALVYNGVDIQKFLHTDRQPQNERRMQIICVARLDLACKGQDILVHALGILRQKRQDFECLLIGEIPAEQPENESMIWDLIASLHLEDHVKIMGNRNDVPALLSRADVLVLPSRYEGFGLVLIEAMMAGVPVIASDVDGPQELLDHNRYGYLVEVENVEQLADTIDHVLHTDQRDLVQRARAYAVDNFSIETMVDKLRRLYLE